MFFYVWYKNNILNQESNYELSKDYAQSFKEEIQEKMKALSWDIIKVEEVQSKICIDDFIILVNTIDQMLIDSNNAQNVNNSFKNSISTFKDSILKMESKLPKEFNIGSITELKKLYDLFQKNVSELQTHLNKNTNIKQIIDEIPRNIQEITKITNSINNIIDLLKSSQIEILNFLRKEINFLEKICKNDSEIKLKFNINSLNSFSIDKYQNNILVFKKDCNEKHDNFCKAATNIISNIIDQYQKVFESTPIYQNEYGINYYFQKEINIFVSELSNIFHYDFSKEFSENNYLSILNVLSSKIKDLSDNLITDAYLTQKSADNYFPYLLNISKCNINYSNITIYNIVDSISQAYEPYIGNSPILQSYQDFFNHYYSDNLKFNNFDKIIQEKIDNLFKNIRDNNKFYYFDEFFHLLIKNIFDPKVFTVKKPNYTINIKDIDIFNDNISSYHINANKEMHFHLIKSYLPKADINKKKEEINIFNKNKLSKYIVHIDRDAQEKSYQRKKDIVVLPYFPMGTLQSIINKRMQNKKKPSDRVIKLTNVDKLIIILEIAEALKDLHENKKYHTNLSDKLIFINSNLDAYIGCIFNQKKKEMSTTIKDEICFKAPETIDNEESNQEKNDDDQKSKDIFSLGVLMYEIITDTIPITIINEKSDEIMEILKNRFEEFLFSDEQNKYFNEKTTDSRGDSFAEFKDIIKRCIKKDKKDRFASIKDIINCIRGKSIYKKNEDEIKYRMEKAIDSKKYHCTFADIVEGYYRGQDENLNVIKSFLEQYNDSENINNSKKKLNIISNDLIKSIYNFFDIKSKKIALNNKFDIINLNQDNHWTLLLNKTKHHFFQSKKIFFDILNSNLSFYKSNFDEYYKEFISTFRKKNESANESSEEMIEKILLSENYFYIDNIYQTIFRNLLNSNFFQFKFRDVFLENNYKDDDFCDIGSINQYNDNDVSYKLCCDCNMTFYAKRYFEDICNREESEREMNIFTSCISKYIVHIKQEMQSDQFNIFPYFPNSTLNNVISQKEKSKRNLELSNVDKLVMIIEIATAINDLHSNGKYHGNLSDEFISISSSFDAYISKIYYNENQEANATKPQSPIFYRAPELFNKTEIISINEKKSNDIYSFGVLMHEIATCVSPKSRIGNVAPKTISEILLNNYKDFLLLGPNNECLNEEIVDLRGDSMAGLKEIIEKCIINKQNRYQSMNDIIKCIKKLPIYLKNKEEIDYRLNNAVNSQEYNCTISDIVFSYYNGSDHCYLHIEKTLNLYKQLCLHNEKYQYKIDGDIIQNIYNVFNVEFIRNSADDFLFTLISNGKNHIQTNAHYILNGISLLEKIYGRYMKNTFITSFFNDFLSIYYSDIYNSKYIKKSNVLIKNEFIRVVEEFQNQGKYYYIDVLFHCLIKNIINSNFFESQLKKAFKKSIQKLDMLYQISDASQFNENISSYKLHCDSNMNFYLQKAYNPAVNEEKRKREKKIFSNRYSKSIVYCDKEQKNDFGKIYIQYFPVGTLGDVINNTKIKFNCADKLVIILEIATALKDLHSNNEFHGNLSNQSILFNSRFDAYIGSFCFESKILLEATKSRGPFYYRSPEFFKRYSNQFNDENQAVYNNEKEANQTDEDYKIEQQSYDIFALGVLMHEIITQKSPEFRFSKGNTKVDRLKILKNDYGQFLFSGENNEFFDDEANGANELKSIIQKCLDTKPNNKYSTISEVIDRIKKTKIFEKNKEEIEYRFSKLIDSQEYECALSDIVESYYKGQTNCYKDVEKFLTIYKGLYSCDTSLSYTIIGDLMQNIFIAFDIKLKEDFLSDFEIFFNIIIRYYIDDLLANRNLQLNLSDKLLDLSFEKNKDKDNLDNMEEQRIDYIIPISTLENFIKHNKDKIGDLIPTWIYFISKELSIIHSINLYHGKLSMDSIGIYYNHETQTFIPSIILFYSFYKPNQTKISFDLKKYQQSLFSEDDIYEKNKKKDIKKLLKIFRQINELHQFDEQHSLLNSLKDKHSINDIVQKIYEFSMKNCKKDQLLIFNKNYYLHENYSSCRISFSVIKNFINADENVFLMKDSIIKIGKILRIIDKFLDNIIDNPNSSIKNYINQKLGDDDDDDNVRKNKEQLSTINSKCSSLFNDLFIAEDNENDESNENDISNLNFYIEKRVELINFSSPKLESYYKKTENLLTKHVYRNLEFTNLCRKSFQFLLTRYIFNLNPYLRFRLTIKLNYKDNFNFREEQFIPINEVIRITEPISRISQTPSLVDGNIVIYIDKDNEFCLYC